MGPLCQDSADPDRLQWVGDPVDVVTGALAEVAGEFSLPGAPPIVWQRHSSSLRVQASMPLGWGQTHEYDRTLRMVVDGWLYTAPGGEEVLFVYGSDDAPIWSDGHCLTPQSGALEVRTPRDELLTFGALEFGQVGRPHRIREPAGELRLDHDHDGRLVRIRDVDDTRVITLDHAGDRVTALWLVAHPQRPRSAPLALMRYRYDDRRDLVEAIDRYGHRQTFTYDEHHRVVARTDRSGYRFEYEYDRDGRCVVTRGHDGVQEHRLRYMPEAQATQVTKGDGGEWLYRYDDVGSITEIIDPQGGVRRFEYDARGTLRKETDPTGNTRVAVLGARRAIVGWTNGAGGYRSSGRPTGPHRHRVPRTPIELELGDLGGRVRRDVPIASPGIAPLFLHGASISTRLFRDRPPADRCRRDELGLLIGEHNPAAPRPRRWSYTPNGWVRRYTDHDGGTYDFQFTSWNHRCAATDPLGRTIRYEYTSDEKTSVVTDPAGNRHFHRRDLRGHITEIHCNGALFESYELDLAGNLQVKRDARGKVVVRHEYGPDNLKSRRILADGEEHRYQYTRDGRYERIYFGEQMLDFAHSSGGRRKADLRDGHGVVHAFDGDRLRATRVLARFTTRYRHFDGGTVEVVDPTGRRHTLRLGERGEVVRELACAIREEQRYDSLGRRLGTTLVDPEGKAVWRRDYHYSAEGDLVAVDESERGRTRYRHDAAHQLSEVHHPDGRVDAYRYDEAANLIGAPHLGRVAVGPGNKLLVANGGDITHDERDRIATWERDGQVLRFHHDALDQIRRIDGLSAPWSAEYDPLGRRMSRTFGGETTTYYWDTDRLAAEVSPSGALRLYVYTDDFALTPWLVIDYAGVDADPASGRLHYLVSDQRGAPVLALDADGEVAWSASIAPYGLASTEGELQIHHRLAGQILDPETGLHYHRFRYYSPELGRYLESDPSGVAGGINLYAYTYNPLVHFDPQGLRCGEHEGDEGGCGEHETPKRAEAESGENGPSPYPPRTREAQAECQRVVDVLNATGVSREKRRAVSVFTHEDGTVSVGISGRNSHKFETLAKQLETELNRGLKPRRYRVAKETMPTTHLKEQEGGNPRGECAEPHSAHAAHDSESPITGMDTRWRGSEDNPHRYSGKNADGAPVHPSQMDPCATCGDQKNATLYMEHANG